MRGAGQGEDAGAAVGRGNDEDAEFGDLGGVAVTIVGASDEGEGVWAGVVIWVERVPDGDDVVALVADVVEGPLIEVDVLFRNN